jgi:hypothetical protein
MQDRVVILAAILDLYLMNNVPTRAECIYYKE